MKSIVNETINRGVKGNKVQYIKVGMKSLWTSELKYNLKSTNWKRNIRDKPHQQCRSYGDGVGWGTFCNKIKKKPKMHTSVRENVKS